MPILRLSHVEIRVPDLELATAYYSEVIGMIETGRDASRVFLKCWDEHQHHSVVLTMEPTHGLNHFGFKVTEPEDLDHYQERLEAAGVAVRRYAGDEWAPGHGTSIRFTLPSGHDMELVYGMQQVGNLLPQTNPPPRPMGLVGIAPPRVDHVFLTAEEVDTNTRFLSELLDFRLTEQIVGDDGFQIASWLEVSHRSHDIAFITGPNQGLHHFAFWVDGTVSTSRRTRRVTAPRAVSASTSSTRWATGTRCSPAATGSTRARSRSRGPRPRWVGRCSTTTASSTSSS
jgi:catechol 2,3-dioxygenase